MLRTLRRPRWIIFTLVALVIAVTCVRLALWQMDRLHGRREYNAAYAAAMAAAPVPIEGLLRDGSDAGDLRYRHVTATGTYDPAHEVILYGRTMDGRPGNHVVTPLVLASGTAVLVDRGWVPFEMDTPPVTEAPVTTGEVEVTGLLVPAELGGSPSEDGPVTTVTEIDVDVLGGQMSYPLLPVMLQLQDQDPPLTSDLPVPPPPPELTEGTHLSYAFQWLAFGVIAVIGWFILVRRESRTEVRSDSGDSPQPSVGTP
jgi:cytochrome oxidase assembly protein ShyY1